jgi:hypothetical protein
MQTDASRCKDVILLKALSPTRRSAASISAAQHGYTLVELLIGVSLGSLVLSSLGVVLMLSEVKVSASIQRNLDSKDAVNRATDLMRREATFSSFISAGSLATAASPLSNCDSATFIRYYQHNKVPYICYKSVDPSNLSADYRSAFRGPCVLVRIGPPYKPNGDLDNSGVSIVQVLLDGLAKSSTSCTSPRGLQATLGSLTLVPFLSATPIRRNADVTIRMASGSSYGFSVRSPNNPAYDGNALYHTCTETSQLGCGQTEQVVSYHYKPFMNSMNEEKAGKNSKENLFYFPYPRSDYVLSQTSGSGFCQYSQCHVSRDGAAVQLSNVDGLIFSDQEIRVVDEP